jgi:metal-responsive CopG/Arc/MetJ family transcriptional regulator
MTTMLSFRADEQLAAALDAEVARSGLARSELLNRALRELLYRLRCERDVEVYARMPLTEDEVAEWSSEAWTTDDADTDWSEVFGG